jgi:hypothetical protein
MICRLSPSEDRVELEGHCVFYLEGEAEIDFSSSNVPSMNPAG